MAEKDRTLEMIMKDSTHENAVEIFANRILRKVKEYKHKPADGSITSNIEGTDAVGISLYRYFLPMLTFNPKVYQRIDEKLREITEPEEKVYKEFDGEETRYNKGRFFSIGEHTIILSSDMSVSIDEEKGQYMRDNRIYVLLE
ncbi:MAG: hypothetical protein ACLFSL_02945 [Candidatus Woesearchaeota archaeon]